MCAGAKARMLSTTMRNSNWRLIKGGDLLLLQYLWVARLLILQSEIILYGVLVWLVGLA